MLTTPNATTSATTGSVTPTNTPTTSPRLHQQRQWYEWDCGIACAYSLLLHAQPTSTLTYRELLTQFSLCEQRIWTIDLAYLLHAYNLPTQFRSRHCAVDPNHGNKPFYDHFDRDTERVERVFQQAKEVGMDIQERHVSSLEILQLLRTNHVLLFLVDQRYISCESSSACCSNIPSSSSSTVGYTGHFILAYGVDQSTNQIYFIDPSTNHSPCKIKIEQLEKARTSEGTDEDIIILQCSSALARQMRLIHQTAIGYQGTSNGLTKANSASISLPSSTTSSTMTDSSAAGTIRSGLPIKQSGQRRTAATTTSAIDTSSVRATSSSTTLASTVACDMDIDPPVTPRTLRKSARLANQLTSIAAAAATTTASLALPATSSSSSIELLPSTLTSKLTGLSKADHQILLKKQQRILSKLNSTQKQLPHSSLQPAYHAACIFAQEEAGSAVCIDSRGYILTCAHCIGESAEEWTSNRVKWLLFTSGRIVRTKCLIWDEKRDLALLKITAAQAPPPHSGVSLASTAACSSTSSSAVTASSSIHSFAFPFITVASLAPSLNDPLICIGQPGSIDLECDEDGVKTNYDSVCISDGTFRGLRKAKDLEDNREIGQMMHECWTYWGHSGAPIIQQSTGHLIGLHSSWDDRTAMRHGVPLIAIQRFLTEESVARLLA